MGKKKRNSEKIRTVSESNGRLILAAVIINAAVIGIYYYAVFPAINLHNEQIYSDVIILVTLNFLFLAYRELHSMFARRVSFPEAMKNLGRGTTVILGFDLALILLVIAGSLTGAKIFRSRSYAKLISIENRNFTEDIPESDSVTNIALMDTDSARIFGKREIGSLSDVVSQYEVEDDYTQINIKGSPMKVSALKYASFFKWFKNRKSGAPGYVEVNPVNSDAEYVKLKKGMKYIPSGWFNDNLQRHVQMRYPTMIISGYYFEVDDEGTPYYVCPVVTPRVGLFSGRDVKGAILCDPVTGKCRYYKVGSIPSYVDRVYDGDLCTRKYNWYGMYRGGFINSLFNQTGCTKTTDDYGFITIDDDVWVYTGVTSVTSDQSNIGFMLMNERTGEARYYKISGAEEFSAMDSAEGQVQEKNYEAAFPVLINVKGQPTYIMVLKDRGGLVKMYAMVNVQQYNIVAVESTQAAAFKSYKNLMASEGILSAGETGDDQSENDDIIISDIQYTVTDGNTTVYIKSSDGRVYKQAFSENEALILLNRGDEISVVPDGTPDESTGITVIKDFKVVKKAASVQKGGDSAASSDGTAPSE